MVRNVSKNHVTMSLYPLKSTVSAFFWLLGPLCSTLNPLIMDFLFPVHQHSETSETLVECEISQSQQRWTRNVPLWCRMLLSYLFPAFYRYFRSPYFNQWLQDVQQDTFFPHPEIAACDGVRTHGGSVSSVPYDIGSEKNEVQIVKKNWEKIQQLSNGFITNQPDTLQKITKIPCW